MIVTSGEPSLVPEVLHGPLMTRAFDMVATGNSTVSEVLRKVVADITPRKPYSQHNIESGR